MDEKYRKLRTILIVFGSLSLVASVVSVFYDLILMATPPEMMTEILAQAKEMTKNLQGTELKPEQEQLFYTMLEYAKYHLIFNVLEIAGVIMMLAKRYAGFHVYAASQIAICGITYLAMGMGGLLIIVISLFCILIYRNLTKQIEQCQEPQQ